MGPRHALSGHAWTLVALGSLLALGCSAPVSRNAPPRTFTPCTGGNWSPMPTTDVDASRQPAPPPVPAPTPAAKPRRPPAADLCAGKTVVADGSSPMIDDLEDGDDKPIEAEGRKGMWQITHDATCVTTPSNDHPPRPVSPEPGNPSRYAMHLSSRDCPLNDHSWGFQFNLSLNGLRPFCAYDVSVYRGLQFWARGNIELGVAVALASTTPMEEGGDGSCDERGTAGSGCYDHYATHIPLTKQWQFYHVEWSEFRQTGWGVAVAFDPKKVNGFAFAVGDGQTDGKTAEFSIDNIAFFRTTPDASPIRRSGPAASRRAP